MPAAMSLRTSVAVCGAMRLRQAAVPPIATSPSISTRSLIAIGMPYSGPTAWPARIALSTASAASRALAALTETKGVQPRFQALDARKRSTGYRQRAAISAAGAWTEVMTRSPADDSGNHAAHRRAMTGNLARQLVRALCHAAAIRSVSVIQTAAPCACICCSACRSGRSRNGCPLTWVCSATPITSG